MIVDFYHLSASPLEGVLPRICERVLEEGKRLLVVAEDGLLVRLDALLWTYAPDAFLPHGLADTPRAARQPILLTSGTAPLNGADNIALADGMWREEALAFERVFYFFDAGHLGEARDAWRGLRGRADVESRYWRQIEGKWVQGP